MPSSQYLGHAVFMNVENDVPNPNPSNQVELLRPLQEINYEKDIHKHTSTVASSQPPVTSAEEIIFSGIMNAASELKHSESTSSIKVSDSFFLNQRFLIILYIYRNLLGLMGLFLLYSCSTYIAIYFTIPHFSCLHCA